MKLLDSALPLPLRTSSRTSIVTRACVVPASCLPDGALRLQLGIRGVAAAYVVLAATELLAMVACMVWLHHQQAAGAKTWQVRVLPARTQESDSLP